MEGQQSRAPLPPQQMELTRNHDNGAGGTRTESSLTRKSKSKITRKMLLEELSAVKSELARMRSENEQMLHEVELSTAENDYLNFESNEAGQQQTTSAGNESLLTTMSNMSLGSLNIPECKPSEGETEVDKKAYEQWKEILNASFNLVRATDERAKMDIFRIKAGPKLLDVMQGTSSTSDMPDERIMPYSNAISRLDNYFGSRTYIIGQRAKLMNTVQHSGESNISFVRRAAAAAKLCAYKSEEEMEALVRTIVKGTIDSRVRVLAHRNWVSQGDMNSLIELVRDREMELFNEEEYQKLNRQNNVTIATVSKRLDTRDQFRRGTAFRLRGTQRGRGTLRRGQVRPQGPLQNACWRCASIYHGPARCPNLDKVCHNCGRRGHLARACISVPQHGAGQKRPHNETRDEEPEPKIAAIMQNGEENEEKVMNNDDLE
ncbi:uncharacterized protein LOC131680570 [Topomyia yanbarensis]|uniref:uncharacterized protein LOC131680570 n=1 Tax=Topomyia yanbarensis TaxID=2498891 RepID=UPI00273C5359|nr:uncharacterized protein LOC131680570 [Topomyia yanbarensis]